MPQELTFTSARVTPDTLECLRQIAERTGEKQYRVLQRIAREELERIVQRPTTKTA
jgi:hypothetical protein